MRNFLITLGVVLAVCAAAFGVSYVVSDDPAIRAAAREGDALAWLRVEFRLDDAQFAAVQKMHEEFNIACSRHCAAIMEAKERRAPPTEVAALEQVCVDAMKVHFRAVAAQMPPEQGPRYLAMVLPRIAGYSHQGAPSVRGSP